MTKKRNLVLVLCLVLVTALVSVGGTIAWLMDKTQTVTNTFTVGNVDIELAETTGTSYKMVPGNTIKKDPEVTVKANSEECYVFVEVTKSANFDNFMTYAPASGWTALETSTDGLTTVYWREQAATTADVTYSVLNGDNVIVKDTVTKAMMDAIANKTATEPTLTFTAYAIQKVNVGTPAEAWALAKAQ